MSSHEELLNELMETLAHQIVADVKTSINETIEREFTKNLSQTLLESEFYRRINTDLQSGLRDIYHEITAANQEPGTPRVSMEKKETEQLFTETSDQLDQIVQATEKATVDIMDIVETQLDMQSQSSKLLAELQSAGETEPLTKLIAANNALGQDLMRVMEALSFQDLTGQRIKRIIHALQKVEQTVFELYVSTGLKIKGRKESPDKDIEQLEKEAKDKVSELKGPKSGVSQSDVDELLAELGFN